MFYQEWQIILAMTVYPEVEYATVICVKVLLKWNNLLKDVILECQCSNRCKKPAVS